MLERDIRLFFFFGYPPNWGKRPRYIDRYIYIEKTLTFFSYMSEKTEKSSQKLDIWTSVPNLGLALGRTGTSKG